MEAIGPGEDRTAEEAGGGDGGEVQDAVPDGDPRPSRRAALRPENPKGQVLDREVRIRADVDEGLEGHWNAVSEAPAEGVVESWRERAAEEREVL